jgi:hypothetical protein
MMTTIDPEDQIVPMAFALVEGENNESWSWFMWHHVVSVLKRSYLVSVCRPHNCQGCPMKQHFDFTRLEGRGQTFYILLWRYT